VGLEFLGLTLFSSRLKHKSDFLFEKARLTDVIAAELCSLNFSEAAAFVGEHAYRPCPRGVDKRP
jgi:hypothetical protein